MATLFKRPDTGRYVLSYVDPFTKRQVKKTIGMDKMVAELALKKVEEQLALAKLGMIDKIQVGEKSSGEKQREGLTLAEFRKKYEERCRTDLENSASTIDNNNRALDYLISIVGDKFINEITDVDILKWKEVMLRKLKRTSVAIYFRHLRSAFNRAFKWRWIPSNPFFFIDSIREQKEDRIEKKHMSMEDVRTLLTRIEQAGELDFYNYILFLLYTGARRSEILRLRWESIDLARGVLTLYQDKTSREIQLPISAGLLKVIESMDRKESGYIFRTRCRRRGLFKADVSWHRDYPSHRFKHYIREAGLSENYKLHSLRHTFSTHLIEKGVPREIVQKLLGHSSVRTTESYDHSIALSFRQYADMVDFGSGGF